MYSFLSSFSLARATKPAASTISWSSYHQSNANAATERRQVINRVVASIIKFSALYYSYLIPSLQGYQTNAIDTKQYQFQNGNSISERSLLCVPLKQLNEQHVVFLYFLILHINSLLYCIASFNYHFQVFS